MLDFVILQVKVYSPNLFKFQSFGKNQSQSGVLFLYLHNPQILWYHRAPELCLRRIFSQPATGVAVFASKSINALFKRFA